MQSKGTVFATTGGRLIARIEKDTALAYDTGLERSHPMEIAIDTITQRIVTVDACFHTASASVVDLRSVPIPLPVWKPGSTTPPVVHYESPTGSIRTGVCGDRIDAVDGYLAISKEQIVQLLDSATGRGISVIHAPSRIVDVMLVRR